MVVTPCVVGVDGSPCPIVDWLRIMASGNVSGCANLSDSAFEVNHGHMTVKSNETLVMAVTSATLARG